MKKENIPLLLIIGSLMLIILNFMFASNEMDVEFWMRIVSSVILIIAMLLTIRYNKRKKQTDI